MAVYKITLSQSSWTSAVSEFYYNTETAKFYAEQAATTEINSVPVPTRTCYKFLGYQTNYSSGVQLIDAAGNFTANLYALSITGERTIYVQGEVYSYAQTVNDNYGSGGSGTIYQKKTVGAGEAVFYADDQCTVALSAVTKPTRANCAFSGYYSASAGGTQYIDANGGILPAYESATGSDRTIYARWVAPYKITVSANSGTGGTSAFYFDSISGKFYAEVDMAEQIDAITPHTRECFSFVGCYSSNNTTSTQRIAPDGTIATDWTPTAAATIYAQWDRVSWKITLNKQSGSGGTDALYYRINGGGLYIDDLCDLNGPAVQHVETPTRTGYDFDGYYSATSGGTQYIDDGGDFTAALSALAPTAAQTFYAHWSGHQHTLTFNYNGGTISTQSKTVTYGSAVGTLPTTTQNGGSFVGWYVGDTKITAATVWNIDADTTADARWTRYFGTVVDFFDLASNALVPIASTSGDTRHRVAVSHGGKYESGVNSSGGIWRNPSVTYVVKANTTVAVQLGKAWAATKTTGYDLYGNWTTIMTVSGYMITTVEIVTEVGKFPTVTVSAVANEGANAVNNFTVNANKFNVSVPVVARSKAQNLLNAISGGGHLQSCRLVAACDPVVCEENLMPCASDIVNGRYELDAETLAANGEAAPTMTAASGTNGGFALIDDPKQTSESDYMRYTIQARREMV